MGYGEGYRRHPAEMLPNVFEMFTQVDQSLEQGLGIGLTLVKRLVEMHGGSVSVKSGRSWSGSEFTVRLPLLVGIDQPAPPHVIAQKPAAPISRLLSMTTGIPRHHCC